jgi:diaminopimelate decarboxylase
MEYLTYQEGRLCVEGAPLDRLANKFGTPFFLLSESRLKSNYTSLSRGLAHAGLEVTVRYCAKTNNEGAVLSILAAAGSHVLVSHPAEAHLALQCGFLPDKIAYQRPVMLEEEIRPLLASGITLFHAHRPEDLDVIERVASGLARRTRVSLRLRKEIGHFNISLLSFLSHRFGFSASAIVSAAQRIRDSKWMDLAAINFYQGTQQESTSDYRRLLRAATRLAATIQAKLGITLAEINLGGGVPSSSIRRAKLWSLILRPADGQEAAEASPPLDEFARTLSLQFREETRRAGLQPSPGIGLEPGRSVVGDAGFLVTRVRAIQEHWVFLDSSYNYLGESPLVLTRKILPATRPVSSALLSYHLSGNTLNTRDAIELRRKLPKLSVGDVLILCGAGAYSISRASRYAGLSPPVYLLREDGSVRMIRRAERLPDLTGPMLPLQP